MDEALTMGSAIESDGSMETPSVVRCFDVMSAQVLARLPRRTPSVPPNNRWSAGVEDRVPIIQQRARRSSQPLDAQ